MPTGHVFIATSLDGFIARNDGGLDWLDSVNASGEDYGYDAFISTIDCLIMGRLSFEQALTFDPWPYTKPIIILSRSTSTDYIPESLSAQTTVAASPRAAMAEAERRGWKRAYVDGGQTIQSFLREGLISDLIVSRVPVLLGSGRPLFGPLERDLLLKHVATQSFRSGLVQSQYEIIA